MNREQIKNFVWQTLLEVVDYPCKIEGKLLSKKIGYGGIERDIVFEGTVDQANAFAIEKKFKYNNSDDSFGGGYYEDPDGVLYEFHPSPEFYGEMMEVDSTVSQTLKRISGLSDRVLSEVDETLVTKLTDFIAKDKELYEGRIVPILNNLTERRNTALFDERNAIRLWGVLINEAVRKYSTDLGDITEIGELERNNVAKNLDKFYRRENQDLFENREDVEDVDDVYAVGPRRIAGGFHVVDTPVRVFRPTGGLFY